MPTLVVVNRQGQETTVEAESGISLMEAIRDAGFDELMAMCGGNCSCATCHVFIEKPVASMAAPTQNEIDLLETSLHVGENSRLSCQIPLSDDMSGLRVVIAPED